jgi:integrase
MKARACPRRKTPLPVWALEEMTAVVESGSLDMPIDEARRFIFMLLLGFYGFLRRSELLSLTYDEVAVTETQIHLRLAKSKTDQLGRGVEVVIPIPGHDSFTIAHPACYLDLLWGGRTGERVFPHAASTYALVFSMLVELIGLPKEHFSFHSLRSGGATAAAEAGV